MLRYTGNVKLIHLLEMLRKEEKLEQGRLPSEVNGMNVQWMKMFILAGKSELAEVY